MLPTQRLTIGGCSSSWQRDGEADKGLTHVPKDTSDLPLVRNPVPSIIPLRVSVQQAVFVFP